MSDSAVVCVVSPGHFSSNPRLVKEASALLDAGFQVRSVTSAQIPWFAELDARVPEAGRVQSIRLKHLGRGGRGILKIRQLIFRLWARLLFALGTSPTPWQLAEALNPDCRRLRRALRRQNAHLGKPFDLAIAHNLAALPAVAEVAMADGGGYAFDAEDSHVDELYESDTFERRLRFGVESGYLPQARYVTAASPGIRQALFNRYGVAPSVILNVFSPAQPVAAAAPELTGAQPLRFFWFSQTAGPDRGLDQFMALAPEVSQYLQRDLALTIVGRPVAGFDTELQCQAKAAGVHLTLLPLVAPDELFQLAAGHHCGLALEHPTPVNKDICLANKIFTYLAAGIPMLLTPTAAHRELAPELGDAALLLDDSPQGTEVGRWLADVVSSGNGAEQARQRFSARFNWQTESQRFLTCVRQALEA